MDARRVFKLSHTYMVAGWLHLPLAGQAPVGGAVRIAKRMNLDAYFPGLLRSIPPNGTFDLLQVWVK